MMADSCEAAVRSVRPQDEESLEHLIRKIVASKLSSGQLDAAPLTLREISTIASSFVDTLQGAFHPRIRYPGDEEPAALPEGAQPLEETPAALSEGVQPPGESLTALSGGDGRTEEPIAHSEEKQPSSADPVGEGSDPMWDAERIEHDRSSDSPQV